MKISDFKGIFQKQDIKLIAKHELGDDYVEFDYSTENGLDWRAGEHGLFTLPGKRIKGKAFRGFSVASTPEEKILKIATRIGANPSSFKFAMKEMEVGETIRLNGPFGWFTLQDENSPIVMVAAGIGITPIRSLLKELEKGNNRFVTLVYSAKNEHIYKDDIEEICKKDERIVSHFVYSKEESARLLKKAIMTYGNTAYYYISGAPSMLKATRKKLRARSIMKSHIITDPFFGY